MKDSYKLFVIGCLIAVAFGFYELCPKYTFHYTENGIFRSNSITGDVTGYSFKKHLWLKFVNRPEENKKPDLKWTDILNDPDYQAKPDSEKLAYREWWYQNYVMTKDGYDPKNDGLVRIYLFGTDSKTKLYAPNSPRRLKDDIEVYGDTTKEPKEQGSK